MVVTVHGMLWLLQFTVCCRCYSSRYVVVVTVHGVLSLLQFTVCCRCYRKEDDPGLVLQIELFDEHKASDEEHLPGKGVDLSSPLDVFHAVYKQVHT